ncbi:phospholipase B-like protein B [Elysia marginata]|uniref:Phospholipase B-like n=1 Tax=Elysia marginata TaxID=1093978 RepID=A0AAV4GME7_9GAST|nr:phospholipase B-like protein B [Elysia marginata]
MATSIRSNLVYQLIIVLSILSFIEATSKLWVVFDTNEQTFQISEQPQTDYVAVASLVNSINQTGWAKLDVTTRAGPERKYNDSVQAYAAGFVEGHLTRPLMKMHWANTGAWVCPEPLSKQCLQIKRFLRANMEWMLQNIKVSSSSSPFWHHVRLFLEQSAGLQDGFAGMPGKLNLDIEIFSVYLWQVGGDMEDLLNLFASSSDEKINTPDPWATGTGHCSALLRLLPDYSDLYVAQDTWSDFSSMLRVLKRYSFELIKYPLDTKTPAPGNTITFSSYPGVLYSGDDFYTISSGLLTQETTIGYSNSSLNKYIKPTSVMEEIFNKSGQPALVAKFGDWFTYERTPRALIFKRDMPKVKDIPAMIKLMRYNNFKHDPLSRCNCTPPYSGENAIAARCDLNPANGTYPFGALGHRPHAATDMKLTNFDLFKSQSFQAQSGPPFDNVPAFQWSTSSFKDNSHVGHPDVWKFPVITFNGSNPMQ